MKNIITSLVALLCTMIVNAQPVITNTITPEVGDSWTITFMENNNFDPEQEGVNQTWDFSDLDVSNSIDLEVQILDQTEITGGPSYPESDFVWYIQGFGIYNYYTVDEDSLSLIAGASIQNGSIDFETIFLNPEDGLHFPLTYGDNYNYYSFFQQFVFGMDLGTQERNGSVEADGYGTIITPNGTYENVLRIIITETSFGFTTTQYSWLDVNNFVPIFLYETSDDPDAIPSLYFSDPEIMSTSIDELDNESLEWNVWQNKTSNELVVEFSNIERSGTGMLSIFDLNGRLIESKPVYLNEGRYKEKIPLSKGLNTSILVVCFHTDEQTISKKILVSD